MKQQETNILILGSSGFIGSNVAKEARSQNWKVTGVSKTESADRNSLDFKTSMIDIRDRTAVQSFLKDRAFDYVVNCSGYIDHTHYMHGGRAIIEQHLSGLFNVVEFLDRSRLKSFIQIGSADEYGSLPAPQNETMREAPIAPYSFAKTAMTHFLQMLHKTEGFPGVILRVFLAYGPGQGKQRFLPQIIKGCLDGSSFPVSEGKQKRDFCHVSDIAKGILAATQNSNAIGETINLASGIPITIREIIEKIRELIGSGTPEYGKLPYRAGESMNVVADITLAKKLLAWQPKIDLETGLKQTIQYISTNHTYV